MDGITSRLTFSDGQATTTYGLSLDYGTTSTAEDVVTKVVICPGFELLSKAMIAVKFDNDNSAEGALLSINETAAKPIYKNGAAVEPGTIHAGDIVLFRYNGSQYEIIGGVGNGGDSGEVATFMLDEVISTTDWQGEGPYTCTITDARINSGMFGHTWLDNPEAVLGSTTITSISGSLQISTSVLPTQAWNFHTFMVSNATDVMDEIDITINGKVDKVQNAVSGNFAALDANGNLIDSGHKHSDYLTENSVASTSAMGIVQLNDTLSSTSTTQALTANQGKILNDNITSLNSKLFNKITATTDFNTITNDGIYLLDWVSNGTTYNRPVNAGGRLEHSTSTGGSAPTKQQTYTTYAGEVYVRGYSNQVWTSWEMLALNSNITKLNSSTKETLAGISAIETYLDTIASGMAEGETRLLRIVNSDNSFSLMTFGVPYEGLIYKQYAGAYTQLTWIGYDSNGKDIIFSRNNSTWHVNSLSSVFTSYKDITATTSSTGSIALGTTTPSFGTNDILTSAHIVGSTDAMVLLARSNAGNWYAKVLYWDMTPVANTSITIRVYGA